MKRGLNLRIIYTIFVFVALAAFDNIIVGLFPPLFSLIAKDLNISVSSMGVVSAVNILVTSISSIYWGYLAGKHDRKKLIIVGTVLWAVSVFLTAQSKNYSQLIIFQVLTGVGLGCIASIGFSVLTDLIPYRFRGMILSLWGMSQGFGGVAGALMASLIAPATDWRTPFEVVSIIGLMLIILYKFIRVPSVGETEPELQQLIKEGQQYDYKIEFRQVSEIVLKRSNVLLFVQGFLINIMIGSLIWLPTLFTAKIQQQGYSHDTAVIASGYLYAILQVGGVTTAFFGYLGDKFQRRSYKGRALMTSIFLFITAPLYIISFILPMKNLSISKSENPILILVSLVEQLVFNPWMLLILLLSFLASSALSSNAPNWLALITDVNLPEHRGTAFSIANLASSLGRTLGNAGIGFVLWTANLYWNEPGNYIFTLCFLQIFLVPAAFCYLKMAKSNVKDISDVKLILRERAS